MKEIRLKIEDAEPIDRKVIHSPIDCIEVMQDLLGDMACEYVVCVHLNMSNQPMNYHIVSKGGLTSTGLDPKELFSTALLQMSPKIMLFHNHPSGNVEPSQNDIMTTQRIVACATMLDMEVLDHIIVSDDDFYSFASHGQLLIDDEIYEGELENLEYKRECGLKCNKQRLKIKTLK